MRALGDLLEALGAVVERVHGRHIGEERLRGAHVGRGLVAADVLLARLHREAVRGLVLRVNGHANDAPGHLACEGLRRGEEARVGPAVAQRHAEALRRAHRDVRADGGRGLEDHERQWVCGDSRLPARRLHLGDEVRVIEHGAVGGRVLQERAAEGLIDLGGGVVAHDHIDVEALGAALHHGNRLWVHSLVDKELAALGREAMAHGHRLGGGRALVEEGSVTQLQSREPGNEGLEVHE
mmetsp:Transcript_20572/g.55436  ORF Transcript_20572/g.55436 Transcript_20572/m.55436 type:complete len:238 (+) Transcript_20572:2302-3015(+)